MHYLYLMLAIIFEVIATSALKASQEFTKFWPSIIVVVGYLVSFIFLNLCLRHISVGIAYAIWCGIGIILVAIAAWALYGEKLDTAAIIGMSFIVIGVVIMNIFSNSVVHEKNTNINPTASAKIMEE